MRDLICQRCARVLIADFWVMAEAETVPMFSTFSVTCSCGARVRVRPQTATKSMLPHDEERRISA